MIGTKRGKLTLSCILCVVRFKMLSDSEQLLPLWLPAASDPTTLLLQSTYCHHTAKYSRLEFKIEEMVGMTRFILMVTLMAS